MASAMPNAIVRHHRWSYHAYDTLFPLLMSVGTRYGPSQSCYGCRYRCHVSAVICFGIITYGKTEEYGVITNGGIVIGDVVYVMFGHCCTTLMSRRHAAVVVGR